MLKLALIGYEKALNLPFPTAADTRSEGTDGRGVIVVNNVRPDSWAGRRYDFGLYKGNRRIIVQPQVGVSGSASLSLTTMLSFGIVRSTDSLADGDIINSLDSIQYKTDVDITKYPTGLTITLTYDSANGMFTFTPSNILLFM